jgi:hypothetical protein
MTATTGQGKQNNTGQPGKENRTGRTNRTGLLRLESHDGTARKGHQKQDSLERTSRTRNTPRTRQDSWGGTARTGLSGQDSRERTARTGQNGKERIRKPQESFSTYLPLFSIRAADRVFKIIFWGLWILIEKKPQRLVLNFTTLPHPPIKTIDLAGYFVHFTV